MPASIRLEIFVGDARKCIDFYTNVLQFKLLRDEPEYIYMNWDNIFLAAIPNANKETLVEKNAYRGPPKGLEIVFEVDDLVAARDQVVERGWKLDADIDTQPWGLKDFRITDPDGYYLRITTHSPKRDSKG
jgi:lactoylglutathione lyase